MVNIFFWHQNFMFSPHLTHPSELRGSLLFSCSELLNMQMREISSRFNQSNSCFCQPEPIEHHMNVLAMICYMFILKQIELLFNGLALPTEASQHPHLRISSLILQKHSACVRLPRTMLTSKVGDNPSCPACQTRLRRLTWLQNCQHGGDTETRVTYGVLGS